MPGLANDLNISEPGYVSHNGSGVFHGRTFQAGTGITLTNADGISGNTTIASTASLTDLHLPRFIVASSTNGTGANFTTIASAIAAAQGTGINSTIALQPGTYTENFTWPAGINIVAFDGDALTPNVTIVGNITCTSAGSRSMSGIRLQTNGAAFLTVSGSAATVVNLDNCYFNCTNNSGITFSSSSGSAAINIANCKGNLGTTGIKLFDHSSAGVLTFINCYFTNTGLSTTASTCSAGVLNASLLSLAAPITFSGTAASTIEHSLFDANALNVTALTLGSSSASLFRWCRFAGGSASAVSISTTATLQFCTVSSSNTNAVTGAGTLTYSPLSFDGSSSTVNTSTQTPLQVGPRIYTNGGISFDGGSNVLANYAVGTWTPTLVGQSTAGTTTYTVQNGYYTRIGNIVFIMGVVVTSAATGTGNILLGGLPFTIKNQTNGVPVGAILSASAAGLTWPASSTSLCVQGLVNTTTANIFSSGSGGTGAAVQIANTSMNFQFNLMYQI